jgi:hypothetical protein
LDHLEILEVDNGDQTGACNQHGLFLVLPPPILVQLWNPSSRAEINCKDLRQLLNTKRTDRYCQALQE